MCSESHGSPRQGPRYAWRNLRDSELPLPRRLWTFAGNSWWKVSHGQSCCGHYGQPGC
jgi:hypothetical protein